MRHASVIEDWIEEASLAAEARGEARSARLTLMRLMQHQFGAVPPELASRIESADPAWCQDRILDAAAARSLEDIDWR